MPGSRINPRKAKLHRSYTVEEASCLFGVHRNTVRAWMKAGLCPIDDGKPAKTLCGRVLRHHSP